MTCRRVPRRVRRARRAIGAIVVAGAGLVATASTAFASTGTPDSTFGSNGIAQVSGVTGSLTSVAYDSNGDVVGAGLEGSPPALTVARFTTSGAVDSTFNSTNGYETDPLGSSGGGSAANAVTVDSNHDVVAAGWQQPSAGDEQPALVRFGPTGGVDSTFYSNVESTLSSYSGSIEQLTAVAIYPSTSAFFGDVVVGGEVATGNASFGETFVAMFSSSGNLIWSSPFLHTFASSSGGGDEVGGIAIDPATNDVIVAGSTPSCGSSSATRQALFFELNSSGSLVASFGSGGSELFGNCTTSLVATGIAVSNSAGAPYFVASGTLGTNADAVVFGLTSTGAAASGFGSGEVTDPALSSGLSVAFVSSSPQAIALSGEAAGVSQPGITLFNDDSSLVSTFGSSGTATSNTVTCAGGSQCGSSIAAQNDGNLLVAGLHGSSTENALALARFVNRGVSVAGPGTVVISSPTTIDFVVSESASVSTTVTYATVAGTAHQGVDYVGTSGSLTLPCTGAESNGVTCVGSTPSTSVQVPVTVLFPTGTSGNLTFSLSLSASTNTGLGTSSATATLSYPSSSSGSGSGSGSSGSSGSSGAGSGSGSSGVTGSSGGTASSTPSNGYYLVSSTGTVFSYGNARSHGSIKKGKLKGSIVAMATTSGNKGYWLVSNQGDVYAFGNARTHGNVAPKQLSGSICAIAPSQGGKGYLLASTNGHVYAFGNAHSYGSPAGKSFSGSIVSLSITPSEKGYVLISSRGSLFTFGNARSHGTVTKKKLKGSVVSIAMTSNGRGYFIASSKGDVYTYGNAHNYGSVTPKELASVVTGISTTPTNHGYWISSRRGDVYHFGDAGSYGAAVNAKPAPRVVGVVGT